MDAARWAGERRPLGLRRRTAKNRLIQRLETAPPLLNTRPPIQPATPQAVNARKTPLLTSTYGIAGLTAFGFAPMLIHSKMRPSNKCHNRGFGVDSISYMRRAAGG